MESIKIHLHISIDEFLRKFNQEYSFLYEHGNRVAGFSEAVEAFDEFAGNHASFIAEFVQYRSDFISSDREAAAFMFALDSMV